MEYRGAGLSKNLSDQPWNYYNQASAVAWGGCVGGWVGGEVG